MDAFILTQVLEKPTEKFDVVYATAPVADNKKVVVVEKKSGFGLMKMIQLILSVAISVYAAYLSWSCSKGEHTFIRIISAMFAWFFGVLYILYYALFRSASCKVF